MPRRKSDRELLDEALQAQAQGTYVDPVAGATRLLAQPTIPERGQAAERTKREAAERAIASARQASRPSAVIKNALDIASIPAALLPSPLAPAAGAYLSLRGIEEAIESPSLLGIGMGALGAVPLVKPLRRAAKTFKNLVDVERVRRATRGVEGAGDLGATFSRERPYRAGGGVSGPGDATATSAPETLPLSVAALEDAATNYRSGATPAHLAALDRAHNAFLAGSRGLSESETRGVQQLDELLSRTGTQRPNPYGHGTVARPPGEFIHPADVSGGQFGFEDLPEISESELSKLQALFRRVTGR